MASRGGFLGHLLWLVLLQPLLGKGYSPSPGPTLTWGSPETTSPPELQTFPMPVSTTALGSSALTVGETWESTQTTGSQTLSPRGCGHRPMRVVGGVPVPRRKWPWQVSLQMEGKHVCGGSLIASQWVMTAAHCITGHKKYTVRLGGKSLYPNSTTTLVVPVEDIVCHRSFDATTLRHDIALVLLAFAVNYSSYIQPVCLPEKACQAETGTECWVTGWGHLAEGLAPMPLPLQETEQHILHQKKCNRMLRSQLGRLHSIVKKGMICAYQDESKGLCKGDSGGPLVCEFNDTWVQVGIVSWGIGCGHRHYPAVYTEVSFYRDWVVDHLSQACAWDSAGFFILLCLVPALGIPVAP